MNNLELFVAMATAPSSAFSELRERPRFWFPLLLVVACTVAVVCWYYSAVDIDWLKDAIFSNRPEIQQLPEAQRTGVVAMASRNTLLVSGIVGTIIFIPAIYLMQSFYLLLASKVTKLPMDFKRWFAFSSWTALPVLLSVVVAAIFLAIRDTAQVRPSVLQPLSINELVLHRAVGSPGHGLLESLSIPAVLSWILMIIGVRVWSQRSWAFSTTFILAPVIVFYGIWSAIAFR